MTCAACSHENPSDATFCGECGAPFRAEVRCERCGRTNPVDTKFCHGCGQRVDEAAGSGTSLTPGPAAGSPPLPVAFAAGRYQVRRFLGEGGKKRVYLAHDTLLDREVAVGVIKTEGLDEAGVVRVRREAQAMGRLGDHPHIVTVFDVGQDGNQLYIVSQFMAGGSVEDLLRRSVDSRQSTVNSRQLREK